MISIIKRGLLPRALVWLVCLGIFFFTSYGFANWVASLRTDVGSLVFSWEQYIPLWPWTIVPYWSIDFLYGLAFLWVSTRKELDTLGLRLLTAQLICISCFLLFPLHFTFERPSQSGFFGMWFDLLMGFDKPYNQAPSLHITLLVVLWAFYVHHVAKGWRWLLHSWFLLIGISVLTTWQHHFFDVPTGVLVGCLCIWLWPLQGSSPLCIKNLPKQWLWTFVYLLGAFFCSLVALLLGSWGLWLFWPAVAFLLVALNYSVIGVKGFQKQANGRFNNAVALLYAPYTVIMWFNSRVWTRNNNDVDLVIDNVYLGRIPNNTTLVHYQFKTVVDLCAELSMPKHYLGNYLSVPVLDMTPLTPAFCEQIALAIEQANQQGTTLVCCGLGYSRSATAIVAWLLWTKRVMTVTAAIALVKQARVGIVINQQQQMILDEWISTFD